MAMFLKSDKSACQNPGPRSASRVRVPNVPRAGLPNALPGEPIGVALNQIRRPWASLDVSPVAGSPIRSGRFGPVSRSRLAFR